MKPKYTVYTSAATVKALLLKKRFELRKSTLLSEAMSFFLLFLPMGPTLMGERKNIYLLEETPKPHHPFPDSSLRTLGEPALRCYITVKDWDESQAFSPPHLFFNPFSPSPKKRL